MVGFNGKDDTRQHSGHRFRQRRACEQSLSAAGTSRKLSLLNFIIWLVILYVLTFGTFQASLKLKEDGVFYLRNLGRRSLTVNNIAVDIDQRAILGSNCLIEVLNP